jgi:septum formation protein
VLGIDTIVTLGGRIYGKARDRAEAGDTLAALAGRTHAVIGGICLIDSDRVRTLAPSTLVTMRSLDGAAIDRYLNTGEWRDRAGAYAIQGRGALLISAIEGDYLNVVGLPVAALVELAPGLFGA